MPNTTVEMLAELFADRLGESLAASGVTGLARIEMEIEESVGQSAVYRVAVVIVTGARPAARPRREGKRLAGLEY